MKQPPSHIRKAIAELTGTRVADGPVETVWVYGEVMWIKFTSFEFECEPPDSRFQISDSGLKTRLRPKAVNIIPGQVTRYRDGGTPMFLIEMSRTMAKVLEIEQYVLGPEELKRKMERIDTSVPW